MNKPKHLILGAASLLAVASVATSAAAAEPQGDSELARKLFVEAEDARLAKDYATCATKAQQAFETYRQVQILGVLGTCQYEQGRYLEAIQNLNAYVSDASNKVEPWIKEAHDKSKARVAQVEVSCNVSAAEIKVDGANAGASPHTTWLLPGEHTFEASKTGYVTKGETKALLAGTAIKIEILLAPEVTGVGGPDDVKRDGLPVWPAAVGFSVAVAGALLGGGMTIAATIKRSDASELSADCPAGNAASCVRDGQAIVDDADTFQTIGIVGFAAAGAALAFSIPYAIAAASDDGERTTFIPVVSPGFAGAVLHTSF